jgi:multidrug transporter EmrE-like cation transporter
MKQFILSWGLIFLSAFFDSYAAYVVKKEFNSVGEIDFSSFKAFFLYVFKFVQSPWLFSALVAFILAPGLWFIALNKIDLTIGYPLLVGFHLVFILLFGFFLLNEPFSVYKITGSILLLISLILIGINK